MKKRNAVKVLSFVLLGYFALLFSLSLVAAATGNPIIDPIVELVTFKSTTTDDLAVSTNVAKYLFIILLTSFVWSILEASGFVKNEIVRWVISGIIGFLGVAYLSQGEVFGILLTYNALGMTLLFIIPFGILLFFTAEVVVAGRARGIVAQYYIWILYFIFLIYRFVTGLTSGALANDTASTWIFLAAIIASFIMIFGNRFIVKKLKDEFT